jgi:hypothetical protein
VARPPSVAGTPDSSQQTPRWSKRDSNRWSPTKRVPFTTILIDLRPFSSARRGGALAGRDHEFESLLLQRGVWCEHDFRERIPSMTGKDFANANPGAALARGSERQRITPDRRTDNCEPIIP